MASLLSFPLLALSLVVFLVSTSQYPWIVRIAIWLVGAALLAAASVIALSESDSIGVLQALADLVTREHGGEILSSAFSGNGRSVSGAITPLFGVFAAFAVLLGIGCLAALTPGESVEKIIRPLNIGLVGATIGGLLVLLIVGVGFGGLEKRQVYFDVVSEEDVIDGDTIRMGDVTLRLWGADAPEMDQTCHGGHPACGEAARNHLVRLIADAHDRLVICAKPDGDKGDLRESFGRPIATCRIYTEIGAVDLASQLIADGYADLFRNDGRIKSSYQEEFRVARESGLGLHAAGIDFLSPELARGKPEKWCARLPDLAGYLVPQRDRDTCAASDGASPAP